MADYSRTLGMAIRLAFDLGLHISTKKYVEEGSMSASEAKARSITIWGCFMNDRSVGRILQVMLVF